MNWARGLPRLAARRISLTVLGESWGMPLPFESLLRCVSAKRGRGRPPTGTGALRRDGRGGRGYGRSASHRGADGCPRHIAWTSCDAGAALGKEANFQRVPVVETSAAGLSTRAMTRLACCRIGRGRTVVSCGRRPRTLVRPMRLARGVRYSLSGSPCGVGGLFRPRARVAHWSRSRRRALRRSRPFRSAPRSAISQISIP